MKGIIQGFVSMAAVALGCVALAQEAPQTVEIHGFGGWGYGNTNGYPYQWGTDEGSYKNSIFTLSLSASLQEKLAVYAQVSWDLQAEGWDTNVDYAFVQWTFSDALRLRIGRNKQPFGIYTEIFNVGTLRPFLQLPQSVYGPAGFVAEGYNGVGVTGTTLFTNGWGLDYDLYGGQIASVARNPIWNFPLPGSTTTPLTVESDAKDALGARLILRTPVNGFSFGFSGYTGKQEEDPTTTLPKGARNWSLGGQVEYTTDVLWARGEYIKHSIEDFAVAKGWYAEVAYKFTPHWQAALRYEDLKMDLPGVDLSMLPADVMNFFKHQDAAAALNYWFTTQFVLKMEFHRVKGNYFATPADPFTAFATGTLDDRTDLFQFGAQFSF